MKQLDARQRFRALFNRWKEYPALLIPSYRQQIPGITDEDALKLAISFIGCHTDPAKAEARFEAYKGLLNEMADRYPRKCEKV